MAKTGTNYRTLTDRSGCPTLKLRFNLYFTVLFSLVNNYHRRSVTRFGTMSMMESSLMKRQLVESEVVSKLLGETTYAIEKWDCDSLRSKTVPRIGGPHPLQST